MRLLELLEGVFVFGGEQNLQKEITKVFSDSRKAVKGGLFVAIKGEKRDGNDYIEQVLQNGAICVITDDHEVFKKYDQAVVVKNARYALSMIWNNYYKKPTSHMKIIAITGTNGKTSCAYYMYNILKSAGKSRGLISTIECLVNDKPLEINGGSDVLDIVSSMTTPDPEVLYGIFNNMRENGVEYIVMEASSHAIEQKKLSPIDIDFAIFTNLSPEHLDFHKNMESYFLSKCKLFDQCKQGLVNVDDEYGARLFNEKCGIFSCSKLGKADFYASKIKVNENGSEYSLNFQKKSINIRCNNGAGFSIYNSMLAGACALSMEFEEEHIINGIFETKAIKGRLERVSSNIFIDYAHTPFAMENVLLEIRKMFPKGKLISLFGCGGDRDKNKRSIMGKIATENSDLCIITADNSRNENPVNIFCDILSGVNSNSEFILIPSRENAITHAISILEKDDVLVLLGKGHENYEIDEKGKHYFSEKEIINRVLSNDKNKAL